MRGLFTAGVIDVLMEQDLWPSGVIGVSAGAAFGCNLKSRQPGRVIRYNKRFAHDRRYCSLWSLLKTGGVPSSNFVIMVIAVSCCEIVIRSQFHTNIRAGSIKSVKPGGA